MLLLSGSNDENVKIAIDVENGNTFRVVVFWRTLMRDANILLTSFLSGQQSNARWL